MQNMLLSLLVLKVSVDNIAHMVELNIFAFPWKEQEWVCDLRKPLS